MGWRRQYDDEETDGERSAQQFPGALVCHWKFDLLFVSYFVEEAEIYPDEISEFLLGEMDETFNCSLEDGSDKEVSSHLCW